MTYGDIRDDLDAGVVECPRCGAVRALDLDRWGLDWPDVLDAWLAHCPEHGFARPQCEDGARSDGSGTFQKGAIRAGTPSDPSDRPAPA